MFCFSQVRLRPHNGWRGREGLQVSRRCGGLAATWLRAAHHWEPPGETATPATPATPKMNGKDTNRNPKKVETCKNLALIVKHCFSIFFLGLPWSNGRSGMPQADLTSWVHQWPWEMPIESWTDEIHMDQEELRRDPKSKDLGHEILVMSTNQEWWQCQNWKKISWWGWWLQESTGTCS